MESLVHVFRTTQTKYLPQQKQRACAEVHRGGHAAVAQELTRVKPWWWRYWSFKGRTHQACLKLMVVFNWEEHILCLWGIPLVNSDPDFIPKSSLIFLLIFEIVHSLPVLYRIFIQGLKPKGQRTAGISMLPQCSWRTWILGSSVLGLDLKMKVLCKDRK